MNYFQLFNLPSQFELDQANLTAIYQQLQKITHPDKFAVATEQEKLIAVQKNAQVNDAFQVLKSPVLRAEHLLQLRGVELYSAQQSMQDSEFLMQQMAWREQLEALGQDEEGLQQLAVLAQQIQQHYQQHLARLQQQLNLDSVESNQFAAQEIRKIKFMLKLQQEIELKEEALTDF